MRLMTIKEALKIAIPQDIELVEKITILKEVEKKLKTGTKLIPIIEQKDKVKWRKWAKADKSMVQCAGWSPIKNLWKVIVYHLLPKIKMKILKRIRG